MSALPLFDLTAKPIPTLAVLPLPIEPEKHSLVGLAKRIGLENGLAKAERQLDRAIGAYFRLHFALSEPSAEDAGDLAEFRQAVAIAHETLARRWKEKLAAHVPLPPRLKELNSRHD